MCLTCLCYRQPKSQVGRSQLVMFFLGPCIIGMAALEMMQTFFKYLSINTLEDLVPSHLSVPKKKHSPSLNEQETIGIHLGVNQPNQAPSRRGADTQHLGARSLRWSCTPHPGGPADHKNDVPHRQRNAKNKQSCIDCGHTKRKASEPILYWEFWARDEVGEVWRGFGGQYFLCLSRVKIFISPRRQQAGIETPLSLCINWHGLILQVSSIQNLVWILIDSLTYRLHVSSYRVIKRLDAVSE